MSFTGTLMGNLVGRAMVPVIGAGGFAAYKSGAIDGLDIPGFSTAPSHYEMQARVVSVEESCRLLYEQGTKLMRTGTMSCTMAVEMLREPQFKGAEVKKVEQTRYSYFAPDGKSTLTGTITGIGKPGGGIYRRNDIINIRIDAKDPSKSEII